MRAVRPGWAGELREVGMLRFHILCLLAALLASSGCSSDEAAAADSGAGDTADVSSDTGPAPVLNELSATISAPWHEAPVAFTANVAKECRFIEEGQLLISGTAIGPEGAESLELKVGVYETVDLEQGAQSFPLLAQPRSAKKVEQGKSAISFDFQSTDGKSINLSHVEDGGIVTLTSLDPCRGTFTGSIVALGPDGTSLTVALTDGAFEMPLAAPSPTP
jgi:hypothetical protein